MGDALRLELPGDHNGSTLRFLTGESTLHEMGWVQSEAWSKSSQGWTTTLIATKEGKLNLPPAELLGSNAQRVAHLQGFSIDVQRLDASDGAPPDWMGPEATPFPLGFVVALGLLALLTFGVLIWAFLRWRRSRANGKAEAPAPPPDPSDVEALKALDHWTRSEAWRRGDFKRVAYGVTEAMKRYMSRRYGLDALEMTSEECVRAFRKIGVWDDFPQWIYALDAIKFADRTCTAAEMSTWVDEARKVIAATTEKKP